MSKYASALHKTKRNISASIIVQRFRFKQSDQGKCFALATTTFYPSKHARILVANAWPSFCDDDPSHACLRTYTHTCDSSQTESFSLSAHIAQTLRLRGALPHRTAHTILVLRFKIFPFYISFRNLNTGCRRNVDNKIKF